MKTLKDFRQERQLSGSALQQITGGEVGSQLPLRPEEIVAYAKIRQIRGKGLWITR